MNTFYFIVIALFVGRLFLQIIIDALNLMHIEDTLPPEFEGYYDNISYQKSQSYLRDTTRFGIFSTIVNTSIPIIFMVIGGFNYIDNLVRSVHMGEMFTGLMFIAVLFLGQFLTSILFSIYSTFIIEKRYGFNKTTPWIFLIDNIKTIILTCLIIFPVLATVLWLFSAYPNIAWVYSWIAVSLFQFLIIIIAPTLIMPLFNEFKPLKNKELCDAIQTHTIKQGFSIKGVFEMDGSRRSSKSNAFFTGLGKSRRIVLYDTLISKHTNNELIAIIAHEIGHYKKKHIVQQILRGVLATGITFYVLSLFSGNVALCKAFHMEHTSIYASFVFFGFLYFPLELFFSVIENIISRRNEFNADTFAATTVGSPIFLITALKKLSSDNLANLTPHPLKVFIDYSHPPVSARIESLKKFI